MDMRKVRAMYFSGTGTTEKTVTAIAEAIAAEGFPKEENINFTPAPARKQTYSFEEDDIVVFGVPVIAGRVPNVLLKFLQGSAKDDLPPSIEGGGALAVPVVLYGNRNYDDALIELRNILEEQGFHTVAGGAFIGEHSFSRILAAGRPDADDLEKAAAFGRAVAAKIAGLGDEMPEPVQVKGETPIRDYYKPRDRHGEHINILKVKPKLNREKCNGCGECVEACPMGSIKPEEPGVVQGICIKCCGCEKKCPQGALYFDDPGYIYHKEELEYLYGETRREPEMFI